MKLVVSLGYLVSLVFGGIALILFISAYAYGRIIKFMRRFKN